MMEKRFSLDESYFPFNKMFHAQTRRWQIMQTMHLAFVIMILVSTYYISPKNPFLSCENNTTWSITRQYGNFYCTGHIVLILISSLQTERIFYAIPNSLGYYKIENHLGYNENGQEKELVLI